MKDKDILKIICKKLDSLIDSYNGLNKKEFFDNEELRASVVLKIQRIGKLGMKMPSNLKNRYSEHFFWTLFFFMQFWDDNENEMLWDLLNGYKHNNIKYESLKDYNEDLKSIWQAELLKRQKGSSSKEYKLILQRLKNKEQQRKHLEEFHNKKPTKSSGKVKIIYTPMGNKR